MHISSTLRFLIDTIDKYFDTVANQGSYEA